MTKEEQSKELYEMNLHDCIEPPSSYWKFVYRVPGGWVYEFGGKAMCFVPYNEEFKLNNDK